MIELACFVAAVAVSVEKPHIVMVIVDDLGHDDMGFLAQEPQIATPNSDRFAKEGSVLGSYYVLPSCSPTRTTLMSGRYPLHTGVNNFIPIGARYGLSPNETTLPQMLSSGGYKTHAVGKWHLGMYSWAQTPTFRGFDSFYGYYNGGEDYYNHTTGAKPGHNRGFDLRRDSRPNCGAGCSELDTAAIGTYSTTLFTAEAVSVIEAHDTASPLFLYLAYQAVHAPNEAPEQYIAPYKSLKGKRAVYAGMVACLDEGFGNVTSALERRAMLENTVLIFSSDNGGPSQSCAVTGASNFPLRGSKCTIWEGGTKAAGFIWTGSALASRVPSGIFPELIHAADWMPTISAMTGIQCPQCLKWDGVSQWAALTSSDKSTPPARGSIYYGITDSQVGVLGPAMRVGCHKLILGGGGPPGGWVPPERAGLLHVEGDVNRPLGWGFGSPPPLPPNPSDTMLLFDLCADPNEHSPLNATNPAYAPTADSILSRINALWDTAEVGCPDPKCPGAAPPSCTHDGEPQLVDGMYVWVPWC